MKVSLAKENEFRTPAPAAGNKQDWEEVINALGKAVQSGNLKPGSPLKIDDVIPEDTPEKNVARALAGAKRSLQKALSAVQGPGGKPLTDYLEVGYIGSRALGIRMRKTA